MTMYAVFDKFNGAYLANTEDLASIDPLFYTYTVVPDTSSGAALPDEEVRWDAGAGQFEIDYTKLEAILKVEIDKLREEAQAPAVTDGFGKAQEYAGKAAEVMLYDIMDPAQFIALTDAQLLDKFTYAHRDAYYQGGTIAEAIERFREGIRTSKFTLAEQAALSQVTRTLVKVETTPEAKRLAVENYSNLTGESPPAGTPNPVNSDLYITDQNGEALTNEQNIPFLV